MARLPRLRRHTATAPEPPIDEGRQPTVSIDAVSPLAEEPPTSGLPAGAEHANGQPNFRERGTMRRRLRFLRNARELAMRDLGGFIFDLQRFRRQRFDLVDAKLAALAEIDRELRALEDALDARLPVTELREAGVSSCPRCRTLIASYANFCSHCGLQLGEAPVVAAMYAGSTPAAAGPTSTDAPSQVPTEASAPQR